jgi:hypothetical protein
VAELGQVGSHHQTQGPAGSILSCRPATSQIPGRTSPKLAGQRERAPSLSAYEVFVPRKGTSMRAKAV